MAKISNKPTQITANVTELKKLSHEINKEINFTVELVNPKGLSVTDIADMSKNLNRLAQSVEITEIGVNRGLSAETPLGNIQLPPLAPTGTDTNCTVTLHLLDTVSSPLDSSIMKWLRWVNDLYFHTSDGTTFYSYPYATLVIGTPGGPTFNFIGARPKTMTTTEMNHAGRNTLLRTLVMAADGAYIGQAKPGEITTDDDPEMIEQARRAAQEYDRRAAEYDLAEAEFATPALIDFGPD